MMMERKEEAMSKSEVTLERHSMAQQHLDRHAAGELSTLLGHMAGAAQVLTRQLRRAALAGQLGVAGVQNSTGDAQKKLDLIGNETVVEAFANTRLVAAIVSEEMPEAMPLASGSNARYILCIDPLDGSSNTDINGPVGTIFGIYRRATTGPYDPAQDLNGSQQVAAGYVMYGPGTVLVYTSGNGVNGFTLDDERGTFVLSHQDIHCPARGRYYSANLGHSSEWHPHIRQFVAYLTAPDHATHRPYSLRYTGALVADMHRTLLEGGLYFYPPDAEHTDGKLRLLYECAPLAFIAEQAGGRASTGRQRILDVQAEAIHRRVPLVIGSAQDVALYEQFLAAGRPA